MLDRYSKPKTKNTKAARERYSLKPKEKRAAIDMGKGAAKKNPNNIVSREDLRTIATYFQCTMGTIHKILEYVGLHIEIDEPARVKAEAASAEGDEPDKKPRQKLTILHKRILSPEEQLEADRAALDEDRSKLLMKTTELARREAAIERDEKQLRARETQVEQDQLDVAAFIERMENGYTRDELDAAVARATAEHKKIVKDLNMQIRALETGTPRNLDAKPHKLVSLGIARQMVMVANIERDKRITELEAALDGQGSSTPSEPAVAVQKPIEVRGHLFETPEERAEHRRANPAWTQVETKVSTPDALLIL